MGFKGWTTNDVIKLQEKQNKKAKVKKPKKVNIREQSIKTALEKAGILHVEQYKFHPVRKWMFDFAITEHKIAIEYEGGIWTGGGHVRGKGYAKDADKYNSALLLGWRVLRYTSENLDKGEGTEGIINDVKKLIHDRS